MKPGHIALKTERVIYTHWAGLAVASTVILAALGVAAKRYIDGKYDSGEWS